MPNKHDTIARGKEYFIATYAQQPMLLVGGEGCRVIDSEGNRYLDFVAGIAVNSLGYGDTGLKAALKSVIDSGLTHCSNLYWNSYAVSAAELLAGLSGLQQTFFCNSGAEANEAALKMARKYGSLRKSAGASKVISMQQSFHGRTYGAITATGQKKYHAGFAPLMPDIIHVPFNDCQALEEAFDASVCAVIIEPLQGEGGIRPATAEFLQSARSLCDSYDTLLIFDEVQCGMGRLGSAFAFQQFAVIPDAVTLAKGLGAGIPIGALVANTRAASIFAPGDHASTFGGNLLAAAAAEVVLKRLQDGSLLRQVEERGRQLRLGLETLQEAHPALISEIRGMGLMQGVELSEPAAPYIAACRDRGLLLVGAGERVIRFVPPLVVSESEVDEMLAVLAAVLSPPA